jgi:uncharacterized membrane protein
MKQNSFITFFSTKIKIHHLFLLIGVIFGTYWSVIIPPFQAPDEMVHFYRAFEISEGHFVSTMDVNGEVGDYLPVTIREFEDITGAYKFPFHQEIKVNYKALEEAKKLHLSKKRMFYEFSASALYSPIPYIPQALAIAITKSLNFPIYNILIAARLFNLFSFLLFTYFAIKIAPKLKLCLFLLALLPMTLQQGGSLSADSLLFGVSFLTIAYIFQLVFSLENIKYTKKHFVTLTILSVMIALTKQAYFLFFILVFLIPIKRFGSKAKYWMYNLLTSFISLLFFAVWMVFASKSKTPIDPVTQLKFILLHPLHYIKLFIGTFIYNDSIYPQFFGILGTGDTPLPLILSFLLLTFLIYSITTEKPLKIENKAFYFRGLSFFLFFLVEVGITVTMLFLAWPQTNPKYVVGIQGRYFTPIFMLLAYGLYVLLPIIKKIYKNALFILVILITLIIASHFLVIRYYPL